MKYWIFTLCFLLCGAVPFCVSAATNLRINEIMYDPSGTDTNREWIEIYNVSSDDVDFSGFTILTDGVSSTHHAMTAISGSLVPAGGYAVIVQNADSFKKDFPNFSGTIFDSSWTGLTATVGKTIVLEDKDGNILDQTTYDPTVGGDNDGNSIQQTSNGAWIVGLPTPGAVNSDSQNAVQNNTNTTDVGVNSSAQNTDSTNQSSGTTQAPSSVPSNNVVQKMRAVIHLLSNITTGIPVKISADTFGLSGELLQNGDFYFALGNGGEYDSVHPESFEHVYDYAGQYIVNFEYKSSPYMTDPEVSARVVVNVKDPALQIANLGDDGSVGITNSGKTDADLSGWSLSGLDSLGSAKVFKFPKSTSQIAGGTAVFSGANTHLVGVTPDSLGIVSPSGEIVATYQSDTDIDILNGGDGASSVVSKNSTKTKIKNQKTSSKNIQKVSDGQVSTQTASVEEIPDITVSSDSSQKEPVWEFVVGSIAFVGAVIFALWKLKLFPNIETKPDEIEIVE